MARTWTRWLPAAVVPLVVAATVTVGGSAVADELPQRSPEDVLTMLAEHEHQPFSAEFEQTSNLGLPQLPGDVPGADGDAAAVLSGLELITSDHHGRVYAGDEDQARLQVFDSFGERDLIRNGNEAWMYSSQDNAATHITLPEHAGEHAGPALTPQEMTEHAIAAVEPSTDLSVRENVEIAGRSAYSLVLSPRSTDTLVGTVSIAVDGKTGMPLRVAVTARGADQPAIEVAYTELNLSAPDPDLFTFSPPAGADVEQVSPTQHGHDGQPPAETGKHVVGSGWDSVLISDPGAIDLSKRPLLTQLSTEVDGGHALQTDLLSVLVTKDGRVLLGAVPLDELQAAM